MMEEKDEREERIDLRLETGKPWYWPDMHALLGDDDRHPNNPRLRQPSNRGIIRVVYV